MSPTSLVYPEFPFIFNSFNPPTLEDITGIFKAIASRAASPKLSFSEGSKKRSEEHKISSTSFVFPRKITLFFKSFFLKKSLAFFLSGPSPTIISLEFIFFEILLKIFRTSIILFNGPKLLICTIIFSSPCAIMFLSQRRCFFPYFSMSTKFGITSISLFIPKNSLVSSLKLLDTHVTKSDLLMLKVLQAYKKDGYQLKLYQSHEEW